MNKSDLIGFIRNREELIRRYHDSKILYYKPCCRVHRKLNDSGAFIENNCPVIPCPDSKHTKFHASNKRIKVVFGGNRSSKSYSGFAELVMSACFKIHPIRKTPNPTAGRWRLYSSDFGIIEKLYIPLAQALIPKDALAETGKTKQEAWENSYDSKYHILHLKGGGMMDFMSYDQDQSKSESVELDGVMADEEMPEDVYAGCLARLISRNGRFWMTVTPLYGISWAMKFLDETDPQVEVFHFSIYDNPYISDQAIKEFEASVPEHEKEARLHGRFMELQGLVYKELRKDIHMLGADSPRHGFPVVFALDPHPRKPSVMTWAYVTPKDDVVFFDELEMAGTAQEIARVVREKEKHHGTPTSLRLIDPAARAQGSNIAFETDTLREFEREGMGFTIADNSEAGYNVVHEYLKYDVNKPLGNFNRPGCYFTKDAQKTWYGMTHLMWDEWNFRKKLRDDKERIKDYKKDFPDCVRYTLAGRPTFRSFRNINAVPSGNMDALMRFQKKQEVRDAILGVR